MRVSQIVTSLKAICVGIIPIFFRLRCKYIWYSLA